MKKIFSGCLLCFIAISSFAQMKISSLPIATGKGEGLFVPVVQAGTTKKLRIDSIVQQAKNYADSFAKDKVYTVKVTVSSAEILDLNATPKTLVAAPGAGKMIVPVAVSYRLNFNTTAYTTNLNLRLRMNGTLTQNSGILGLGATSYSMQPLAGGAYSTDITNTALTLDVATGNPAAGNSTMDVYVTYTIITL